MLYGKPENLLDKLFNYIQNTKDEKLELKPNEFNENTQSFESKFEQMNETIIKDKNSIITNENKIICDNIIEKFFSLNNEKFLLFGHFFVNAIVRELGNTRKILYF